jgi:hypothetical protein
VSDRIVQAIVLAEDQRSGILFRRYVQRALDVRKIRVESAPRGKGSAYDWVIQQYPKEVKEQRNRVSAKNQNNAVLLVHVDADNKTVVERAQQLEDALRTNSAASRTQSERIAVCVPKRNTETWIHGLCGIPVDETYDFKRDDEHRVATNQRKRDEVCGQRLGPATSRLYALTRDNARPAPDSMPSVAAAVVELRRLEP